MPECLRLGWPVRIRLCALACECECAKSDACFIDRKEQTKLAGDDNRVMQCHNYNGTKWKNKIVERERESVFPLHFYFKSQKFIIYAQLIKFPYKQHILWLPFTVVHHRFACTWFLLLAIVAELFSDRFFFILWAVCDSLSCLNLAVLWCVKIKEYRGKKNECKEKNIHTMHFFLSVFSRFVQCNLRVMCFYVLAWPRSLNHQYTDVCAIGVCKRLILSWCMRAWIFVAYFALMGMFGLTHSSIKRTYLKVFFSFVDSFVHWFIRNLIHTHTLAERERAFMCVTDIMIQWCRERFMHEMKTK